MRFFDLDHTLFKVNTSFCFGKYLYQQGVFSTPTMLRLIYCYALHTIGYLSIKELHETIFRFLFLGHPLTRFTSYLPHFIDQLFNHHSFPPVLKHLREAQQKGQLVAILSSSPDFLVQAIAQRLNVPYWLGTKYAVDNEGILCEISHLVQAQEKKEQMQTMAREAGKCLSDSIAYSDSYLDLIFLRAAGKGVGVRPDRRLRTYCKQMSWDIIEE